MLLLPALPSPVQRSGQDDSDKRPQLDPAGDCAAVACAIFLRLRNAPGVPTSPAPPVRPRAGQETSRNVVGTKRDDFKLGDGARRFGHSAYKT